MTALVATLEGAMRFRRTITRLLVAAFAMLAMPFAARSEVIAPADHPTLIEEQTFLQIRDGAASYGLEALIVRPAAATGKLPIALITHGNPASAAEIADIHATKYASQARDLAYRGYLAVVVIRRGFGASGGTPGRAMNADFAKCSVPDLHQYFAVEALDLERALRVIAARPDADPSRVIAIGASVGGGAVIALAARNPPGLKAVVNLSGGVRLTEDDGRLACPQQIPDAAIGSFGRDTKIPSLWVYSENDSLFGPADARTAHALYVAQGGVATLNIVPALKPDGHFLTQTPPGRRLWLAALDPFLRALNLPSWRQQELDALVQRYNMGSGRRQWLEGYFSYPTPKVLVRAANGAMNYSMDSSTAAAEKAALERCANAGGMSCTTVMRNFEATPVATN